MNISDLEEEEESGVRPDGEQFDGEWFELDGGRFEV